MSRCELREEECFTMRLFHFETCFPFREANELIRQNVAKVSRYRSIVTQKRSHDYPSAYIPGTAFILDVCSHHPIVCPELPSPERLWCVRECRRDTCEHSDQQWQ